MKQHVVTLLVLTIEIFLGACTKDNPDIQNPNFTSYTSDLEQFKVVWQGISTNYVLWLDDSTNWDSVYHVGLQAFSGYDDNLSDSTWENIWKEMTHSLIDHHMVISLQRPSTHYSMRYSPGEEEVGSRSDCSFYIAPEGRVEMIDKLVQEQRITDTAKCNNAYCGLLDNDIAYLYIAQFFFDKNSLRVLSHYKTLLKRQCTKAAILDLRDNLGGRAKEIDEIMSCFIDDEMIIGYTQLKTGLNRYDLGPQVPDVVVPKNNAINFENPIVVMTTSFSASMAEITTLAIRQLDNGYSYGFRTYGATCSLTTNKDSLDFGPFGEGDGSYWVGHDIRIASSRFTNSEGVSIEGYGILPNEECHFSVNDYIDWFIFGKDNQLEGAILFARGKCKCYEPFLTQ